MHYQLTPLQTGYPDQESERAAATVQPGGLGIQKQQSLLIEISHLWQTRLNRRLDGCESVAAVLRAKRDPPLHQSYPDGNLYPRERTVPPGSSIACTNAV